MGRAATLSLLCFSACTCDPGGLPCEADQDCAGGRCSAGACLSPPLDAGAPLDDVDCDGIADANETAGTHGCATDSRRADTDGDGIPDGVEAGRASAAGCPGAALDADPGSVTSACDPDTDGDGLMDGVEDLDQNGRVDPGELDPRDPGDAGGPVQAACATKNLRVVAFQRSGPADLQIALLPDLSALARLESAGIERGLLFYDPSHQIAGAALARTAVGATAAAEEADVRSLLGTLGAISAPIVQTFTTWDGYPGVRALYDFAGKDDLVARANALARAFYPAAQGLLGGHAGAAGPFKLQAEVVRRSPERAALVFAVTPLLRYTGGQVFRADDLAGGSALAQAPDTTGTRCEVFQLPGAPPVDFLWVVDDSRSMAASQGAVAAAGSKMIERLAGSTLDWSMGAVTTDSYLADGTNLSTWSSRPFVGKDLASASGIITGWFQAENTCMTCAAPCSKERCGAAVCGPGSCALSGTPCAQGCWFGTGGTGSERGLLSARRYLERVLLPASPSTPQPPDKLRAGARLHLILLGDADDQSTAADLGGAGDVAAALSRFFADYDGAGSAATVHGIVCPVGGNCNGETQMDPRRNIAVIQASGGVLGDITVADRAGSDPAAAAQLEATIDAILGAAIGASGHPLSRPPISATLKVAMDPGATVGACPVDDVPRSRTDGFDFDQATRRISFFGACRPNGAAGKRIAVSYRSWVDGSPPPPDVCGIEESCADAGPRDAGACLPEGTACGQAGGADCCRGLACEAAPGGGSALCVPIG